MGSITQEVVVLNTFGFEERRRTTGKGTTNRYTVTITADPVVHVFDPRELGRAPADAIAEAIRKGIKAIGEFAKPATRARREGAAKAFAARLPWAVARYSGGRTGDKAPNQTGRLFNDSGRLADGIFAGPNGDGWVVNVPVNRFDPATFTGGVGALVSMYGRLRELVPALQGPEALRKIPEVRDAIESSILNVIQTKGAQLGKQRADLMRAIRGQQLAIVKQIVGGIGLL